MQNISKFNRGTLKHESNFTKRIREAAYNRTNAAKMKKAREMFERSKVQYDPTGKLIGSGRRTRRTRRKRSTRHKRATHARHR